MILTENGCDIDGLYPMVGFNRVQILVKIVRDFPHDHDSSFEEVQVINSAPRTKFVKKQCY